MQQGAVCIPNIGARQRRLRLLTGIVLLAITAGMVVAVVLADAPILLRTGIFLPALIGVMGVLQAHENT